MGKKKHDAHYFNKKSCLTAPKPPNKMEIGKAARYIPAAPQAAVCAERNQKRGLRHTVISATMPTQAFPIHIKPWLISWQPCCQSHQHIPLAQCLCLLHRILPPAIRETQIAVR